MSSINRLIDIGACHNIIVREKRRGGRRARDFLTPCSCRSLTTISDVSAKLSIIKTCTKNVSCELQINATRHLMPCDTSLSSWACTSCCYDNACNVSGADRTPSVVWTRVWQLWIVSLIIYYVSYLQRNHGLNYDDTNCR